MMTIKKVSVTIIPYPKNDKENLVTIILSLGKINGNMVTHTLDFWCGDIKTTVTTILTTKY